MATILQLKRRVTGLAGAPSALRTAELAYNMADGYFYVGYGDDGNGNATSIRTVGKDDFDIKQRVPSGGTSGQYLTVDGSGNVVWGAASASGPTYTAGSGITINSNAIALDTSVAATQTDLALKAPLASPALTGTPTAPTPVSSTNTTQIATTAYVKAQAYATLASPTLTGTPAAPTATAGTNTTQLATTAFVTTAASTKANIASPTFTGTPAAPTAAAGTSSTQLATTAFVATALTSLNASNVTTGTLPVSVIPVLPSQTVQVSSGDLTALTTGQQSAIAAGTVVTTSDGNRWVYSGSGSKTASASYIQLADITPEWSVIANKPAFATVATSASYSDLTNLPALKTVATSGAYSDLTGLPTLGTIASQSAANVAITGGTINGVTLDGGTF